MNTRPLNTREAQIPASHPSNRVRFSALTSAVPGDRSVYFFIRCVTACSKPSIVSSNMGKIWRMAAMLRV